MKDTTEKLVDLTRDGYNRMAKDWAGTRMNFWQELTYLVRERITTGENVLDLGCGNARFYREIDDLDIRYYGCDFSEGLIQEAKKYHPELDLVVCDVRKTPYEDAFFDMVVSFAVLHHLAGKKAQQAFFDELYRILKPGGTAVVTVWDIWKTRKKKIFSDFFESLYKGTPLGLGGTVMHFTQHTTSRYVYGFSKRELRILIKKSNLKIERLENIKRESKKGKEENIVMVVRKDR